MTPARSFTIAAASLADADGIKTSVATSTDAVEYTGADLDGALVVGEVAYPTLGSKSGFASYPSVTSSSQSGAYEPGSKVVFTGTYRGEEATSTATLTEGDGDETQLGDKPLDTVTAISVEAQADTDGAFTFGFSDLVVGYDSTGRRKSWSVMANTAGNVHLGYSDGSDDTISATAGIPIPISPVRVYADTAVAVTIFE